jgi:uncharacterized delta-60 repeat protein
MRDGAAPRTRDHHEASVALTALKTRLAMHAAVRPISIRSRGFPSSSSEDSGLVTPRTVLANGAAHSCHNRAERTVRVASRAAGWPMRPCGSTIALVDRRGDGMPRSGLSRCVFALALVACTARAGDGNPDPAFGDGGQVTILRPPDAATATAPTGDVAALPDGRFLWIMANEDGSVWVGRASHDGVADVDFGSDGSGHVTLTDCAAFSTTRVLAETGGGATVWSGRCLLRLDPAGNVIADFGGKPLPDAQFLASAFARDHAGRYLLAGTSAQQWRVFRFAADGTPDVAFGEDGAATVAIPATNNLRGLNAMAVRDDDRVVLAGWRGNTHGPNLVVAQLDGSGDPDPDWNGNGLADLDAPSGQSGIVATALAAGADGSVLVAGNSNSGSVGCCLLLAKFDGGGQLVPMFGMRLFDLENTSLGSFFEARDALHVLPDGRMLFGTTAFPVDAHPEAHRTQFILIRTSPDGLFDPTFGNGGWRGYTISDPTGTGQSGDYDQLHAVAVDETSALLFGRTFFEDNSNGRDYVSMVRAQFDAIFANGLD